MRKILIGSLCLPLLAAAQQPFHADQPFTQDYSVKYYAEGTDCRQVGADRNGAVKLWSPKGLRQPAGGQFLQPGQLQPDRSYRTLQPKKISAMTVYEGQFVYLDDRAVLSNAWAGTLYARHELPGANLLVGGRDFAFLISDGRALHLVNRSGTAFRGGLTGDAVQELRYSAADDRFWILGKRALYAFRPATRMLETVYEASNLTAFTLAQNGKTVILGTPAGYLEIDAATKKTLGTLRQKLPVPHITALAEIRGQLWFGSTEGAFALRPDGKFDYYNGERWLPGNEVRSIAAGPGGSVLVLTNAGLGQIHFRKMTLADKARFFEEQVRGRHIRHGFNASLAGMEKGNPATGYLEDSDNDGLWTSMYLAAEAFRYTVTKEPEALENCRESLDAMERLFTVNPVPGFPARSFERRGIIPQLADPDRWQPAPEPEWDWKATTSSDEAIGHIFAYGVIAELVPDTRLKRQAITLIDTLMSHILKNDLYLIDYDGKPTRWGRWNPTYVNGLPISVGDRKLNSSNIIAMLQTAYHFTKKEKYKRKAVELMEKHGYLENLMRLMRVIGQAPDSADPHAKDLSENWNHSDDEMYFLGYWGLYRYAFTEALREKYKAAILDHWEAERPEKEGAWNIFTALTGTKSFDLKEAVGYLQQHPLDLIDWNIRNSHRKDLDFLPANFRRQTTREVLPPDERPIQRHNANMFDLDRTGDRNGLSEHSAGDIWLLPYWMGRYLRVIR